MTRRVLLPDAVLKDFEMSPYQFRTALKSLGLTYHTAATALGMGKWGFQSVGKWARGEHTIPAQIVEKIQAMLEQQH